MLVGVGVGVFVASAQCLRLSERFFHLKGIFYHCCIVRKDVSLGGDL